MKLSPAFDDALIMAARLHADQERKVSGVPYVAHLLRVCGTVLEYGGNETTAIAALLHDAVEDQGGLPTLERIIARFGPEVGRIVLACSDSTETPKPPWRERKVAYLAHLEEADAAVLLVSLADKLDNGRSIVKELRQTGHDVWRCFRGGRDGTLWYYTTIVDIAAHMLPGPLTDELTRVVDAMRRLSTAAASR